ncbi:MAG: hypothetical protein F4X97_01670, partial [Boseongicola sp. SB0662_bin_57]|nr:hypothetical protein [Boseongicola sp. SB0662_bin_57]
RRLATLHQVLHFRVERGVDFLHIKKHYYGSHAAINPTRIVPIGPEIEYTAPHDRARLGQGTLH